jgi:type II restriction/modification system DNA methylase subunit YeeA
LDEKIVKTDRLIDEIVYDLYGLTDEEIEVVESEEG